MTLSAGTKLGSYQVTAQIGAGGMGEVYQAHDTKLGRDVAIKVLPEAFAHDPERLSRFQREAKTLASLNHPNIAAIYGLEENAGSSYLVMELVPGDTLADRIKRDGAFSVVEAIAIAKQMAEALEAAHEKGIVHRDLKPANVKVTPEGKVKVLDFGLAKAFADDGASQDIANSPTMSGAATMQGVILGTAAYMSPEQARGKSVDRRTDIWAFGVVLYEMLTGQQLFAGETVTDTLAQVITKEPEWERVPARTQPLLRWCLERDQKKRLRDIADGMTSLEAMPDEQKAAQQSAIFAPKWLWGIAIAGCLAAATLAVIHFREKPPAAPDVVRYQIRLPEKVTFSRSETLSLSPDGRHVAFSAIGPDGNAGVWVQDLDAEEARALPDTGTGTNPPPFFWSPDSRFVVFSGNSDKLRKADIQGGPTRDICNKPGPPIGGSWNSDGVIIFGNTTTGLWRVPAEGGTAVPLTVLDASRQEREHELPIFLPDGKHFLYLRISKVPEDTGIYAGSLDDPPEKQSHKLLLATGFGAVYVPSPGSSVGRLLFLRQSILMAQTFDPEKLALIGEPSTVAERVGATYETGYFSATPNALVYKTSNSASTYQQLTWIDNQGKITGTVGDPGLICSCGPPRFSPDGSRVAYSKASPGSSETDVWLLDLARGADTRLTFGGSSNDNPVWSPDGSEIVFASNRKGHYDLYRKPANGAKEEEVLLESNEHKRPWSWSRDGRYLIYSLSKSYDFISEELWVLPMQGDRKPFPFATNRFDEATAEFSPDGRWVAYTSDESGAYELYVREFRPPPAATQEGGKWQISNGGGMFPTWRSDGKELSYHAQGKTSQMSVSIDTGASFHAGVPRVLFPLPPTASSGEPTADLKRFLAAVPAEQKGPQSFTVMLNWAAGLKK
jgi:eukaryotic-like serine/threonine-protein kinase